MKRLLLAAALLCLVATEAQASPPLGWPGDFWACSVPSTWCLKMQASGNTPYALRLEGLGAGNGGGIATSSSAVAWTVNSVSGTGLAAFSQTGLGIDVVSQTNIAVKAVAQATSNPALFGQNTAGGTAVIGATNGPGAAFYGQNFAPTGWAVYADGRTYAPGGVWTSSDRSLKKDIADSKAGLSDLLKLRPATWAWKDAKRIGPLRGFIADEVAAVFPEMVGDNVAKDGTVTKVMQTEALTPVMVKAIQELEARVKALEAAIKP